MPAITEINHLSELIGPPPRRLAWLAIGSFIGLLFVFFILFFVLHFRYEYNGTAFVSQTDPRKVILTLDDRSETAINRINNGDLSISIKMKKRPSSYIYQPRKGKKYLGNNQFIFDNETKLSSDYKFQCIVYLHSLTLYQRFIHKYYKL